ncbi:MAG: DUF3822 family protein [Bacteroidales bacterium]|nr:DUF3822 family protein [Bacteroidales bacterium]
MFTLVPVNFFDPSCARQALLEVAPLADTDKVSYKQIPRYSAVLVYNIPGREDTPPGIFDLLQRLHTCSEYNKVLCTWQDGMLSIAIAQGKSLLLANEYKAPDFTTAQYFIFLAMKSLQLNPEVTTISFTHPLGAEEEMALYRCFKAVEVL